MAYMRDGYANRVLSTRLSSEHPEGPEEESWYREFNVPFGAKRSGSQAFNNQGYPEKRPRNTLEAPNPYGRQENSHAVGINGNISARPSVHLPPPANLRREQAQYGATTPQLNMMQSMPYNPTNMQPSSTEYPCRLPSISHLTSQTPGNYASSHQSPPPQSNHMTPSRPSLYTDSDLRQPDVRKSLARPYRPGENTPRQLFQPQDPRGSRASSVAPPQGHAGIRSGMKFTSPRYQTVPPLAVDHQRPAQYAASEAGALAHSSQSPPEGFQRSQGIQDSPPKLQRPPPALQPSPMTAHSYTMPQTGAQPRSETGFVNAANSQKIPVVKRTGPFIIDDDEVEIELPESLIINTETRSNTATTSQIQVPTINFAQGRRGARPLTSGLGDPPDRKIDADGGNRKNKSGVRRLKKADDTIQGKLQKQAEAYAKIKEKEDMAAKTNNTNALFEEPINEAAQARIQTCIQKDEMHRREVELKRKHKQALAEELESMKKEVADRERAQKELERAERASRKSKTQEEREKIQKTREAEEKKRLDKRRREAEELLLQKRQEQSEREAVAREKEAVAENKRQEDAENLKKTLETSRLAATSLKSAKKGQGGREENSERVTTVAIETPEPPDDDGGLFVPEEIVVEPSDEAESTNRSVAVRPRRDIQHPPLTPKSPPRGNSIPNVKTVTQNTEQKLSNIAAAIREIPGSEALSLRKMAGWRGAIKANTEMKTSTIMIEHHKEQLSADQKIRDEALALERARERTELKDEFATLFGKLASTLTGQVQGELRVAVDRVLNVRPPAFPINSRSGPIPVRGIAASPKKYASETQCFLGGKTSKQQRKELAPLGEKSPSDSEARRRDKEEMRLVEKARKRFEVKLHRDNAEQSRPMSEHEFRSHIERQVKDYREKREKKIEKEMKMMPHGGRSSQSQARFGYEDIDFNEVNSSRPNKPNSRSDKGRCGGAIARLRESNGSLGHFQEAASAKIVNDRLYHLGDDADSESEVSEEDPDDDELDTIPMRQPKLTAPSNSRGHASDTTATEASTAAVNYEWFGFDNKATQLIKPRYLQDKEMVYIFSVQRSEIRAQEKSLPITIKQFFDKDEANDFAEEELRRTRWGPSMPRPQITQSYSKDTGLFTGRAAINPEDDVVECVDVVAQAQYIGDLDDFEHEKVRVIFTPKLYFIFKSITKKVQTSMASYDDEVSESEEAEQNMETDQNEVTEENMDVDQDGFAERTIETDKSFEARQTPETDKTMRTDQNCEAKQAMEADQNHEAKQNTDSDQNDNEESDERKSKNFEESGGDAIDALFEEEAEEAEVELSGNSDQSLAANVHQLSLDSTAPPETKPEMTLTQTSKPLEVYTDRELANKRASEIFLAQIRPVGGDISQLVAFQNDAVKPVRESLENHNKSGELFFASNDYENNGEEVRVWVEDFEIKGPLN
ncbi:hypothetical protein VE03_05867 [Pseudogymnoascus sp. 23342-1-I1]|nr:hypothetical protein VE03_05867 [Pseudogymnoascus sp. 23342-1-I1]